MFLRILQDWRHHLLDTMLHLPGPRHHLGIVGEEERGKAVGGEIVLGVGTREVEEK